MLSTDLQQVKSWMQDHFSQLMSMIKKNTEAINNLRFALQKKDRKVNKQIVCKSQHKAIITIIIPQVVGGECETRVSDDVLIMDKPLPRKGTYNSI